MFQIKLHSSFHFRFRLGFRLRHAGLALALALCAAALLSRAATAQPLTISAATSLTDAFKALAPRFEASQAGTTLRFNFAASGVLLQQIAQGAPVDVFASADQETMQRAATQKLVDPASRRDFATNSVVLIEPAQDGPGLHTLKDVAGPAVRRIAIGKPATVPVGRYTREVLDASRLWSVLEPRFVQADSVRQVLDYVGRGEADAGFVYRTDAALAEGKVRVVLTATGHTPVRYPVALVADSRQPALALAFIRFLDSAEARQILARHGFGSP